MQAHLNMDDVRSFVFVKSKDYADAWELAFGDGESIVNFTITEELMSEISSAVFNRNGK